MFGIFNKKNDNTQKNVNEPMSYNTNQTIEQKVSLLKEEVRKVCLNKEPLRNLKAEVALVIDYSGSMHTLYDNGTIQRLVEKVIPMALTFDDDGRVPVWIFNNGYHRLPDLTMSNIDNYIDRETARHGMGGTSYAPVMNDVRKAFAKTKLPSYVLFVTDGDNDDHLFAQSQIVKASKESIFWQFVGVGRTSFSFLSKLDAMSGRYVDNANLIKVDNIDSITYNDILNEFPQWLSNPKVKAMIGG